MPTNLPPRRKLPSPRQPMLVDAVLALGIALITVSAADFLFWLTS
jgi:hypothetical protein